MSISITDIRNIRRNALQNLRRGFNISGIYFEQNPELFPTGKGMSPSQLESLYNYYEQFQGHRFSPEEFQDIGFYTPTSITEEEFLDEDYYYDAFDDEDTVDIYYIEQAKDVFESTGYYPAINQFNDIVSTAVDVFGVSAVEEYLADNMELIAQVTARIDYLSKGEDAHGSHSTQFLSDKVMNELRNDMLNKLGW